MVNLWYSIRYIGNISLRRRNRSGIEKFVKHNESGNGVGW